MTCSSNRNTAKTACIAATSTAMTSTAAAETQSENPAPDDDLAQRFEKFLQRPRPRLIIPEGGIVAGSVVEQRVRALLPVADSMLDLPPLERKLDESKKRIVHVSRGAQHRIATLGAAWQLTRDEKYLRRGERELLAVSAFTDWNPPHYLDTAEMMLAVALGLDWFHDGLPEDSREKIAEALHRLGLSTARPELEKEACNWWMTTDINWAQVCHMGATAAALALADRHPALAQAVVRNALEKIRPAMEAYTPDGVCPEGPSYWSYGAHTGAIFLMLVERSLGTSRGVGDTPSFAASVHFMLHATGPFGLIFNFADNRREPRKAEAFPWFYERYGMKVPAIVPDIRELIDHPTRLAETQCRAETQSFYPVLTTFALDEGEFASDDTGSLPLDWHGRGKSEMVAMRSGWDTDAWYVGVKGGTPNVSHGHCDVGGFILDAFGLRWAEELGAEHYAAIEARGMKIWDHGQESDRWKVFRYGASGHNLPVIDELPMIVAGCAVTNVKSLGTPTPEVSMELDTLYGFPLRRDFRFAERKSLVVTDTLRDFPSGSPYRWQMFTRAEARVRGSLDNGGTAPGILELSQEGKTLRLVNTLGLPWRVDEASDLLNEWDSPLPGVRRVSFSTTLPEAEKFPDSSGIPFEVTVVISSDTQK